MKQKNIARLNPDRNSLLQHVMRANYQIFVFENYHSPSPPPSPFGNGWERDVNGNTVPVESTTASAPDTIQDLREIHTTQNDEEDSASEIEYTDEEMDSGSDDILYYICVKAFMTKLDYLVFLIVYTTKSNIQHFFSLYNPTLRCLINGEERFDNL